jgi:RNA polymerase sigma-70 factor (ECF subfamily)
LFRIATNLVNDHRRRPRMELSAKSIVIAQEPLTEPHLADRAASRIDLLRALARLKPRERSMLWLAYAQGWSHEEIASSIGVKTASLKPMLHRARQRLAALLKTGGQS